LKNNNKKRLVKIIKKSAFTLIFSHQPEFQRRFIETLEGGSIPVLMSSSNSRLPFDEMLDWRLATVKLPLARLPELLFILRSYSLNDRLEMHRKGRFFLEKYLMNSKGLFIYINSFIDKFDINTTVIF
jgi:hypothetical protein